MYAAPTPLLMHLYAIAPIAFLFFMLWLFKNKANQDKVKRMFDGISSKVAMGICYLITIIFGFPGWIASRRYKKKAKKAHEKMREPEFGYFGDPTYRN